MDSLGKISIAISIIGIIGIFFITENFDFNLNGINNMTEENINKDITFNGKVINTRKFNNSFVITIKTECYVDGFYYDKKNKFDNDYLNSLKYQNILLKGTIEQKFNPSINIKSLELK